MMGKRSFGPLFVTNLFGTMNDNFLKTLASFVVIAWISDPKWRPVFMGVTAGALVLPYILFSPLADRLTVLFSKRRILTLAKIAEIPIVAVGIVGFALRSPVLVVAAILLMGLQSSLYSPAKYALVRDVGGEERISTGLGGMDGIAFLGVLAGTIAASLAADSWTPFAWYATLLGLAIAGLLGSLTIRADEVKSRAIHSVNPWRYLCRAYRMAKGQSGLNAVILTLSVFWWAAAMLQMGILVYGKEVLHLDSTRTGALLCAAAVGIVAGQVLAGLVDRRHPLLPLTPITGTIAAALLAALYFIPLRPVAFGAVLSALAFDLGFFKLPFDAEIQRVVKGPKLNTMLAYFNQMSFLFMFAASGCYALASAVCGPRAFLLVLAIAFVIAPLVFLLAYRPVLMAFGRFVFARRYAVTVTGLDTLPRPDAPSNAHSVNSHLVLPNHPAMVDPMLVNVALADWNLRPLVDEAFFRTGLVAPLVLRTLGAVAVPDLRKHRTAKGASIARGLSGVVAGALAKGSSILFYPSGHIQTEADREEIGTRQLAYTVCRDLPPGTRVIGVRTRGLWGSVWSRCGRSASPAFVPTLVRSVLLWLFVAPFKARRSVTMHVEDLTDRVRAWSELTRIEFNRQLEAWYAEDCVPPGFPVDSRAANLAYLAH